MNDRTPSTITRTRSAGRRIATIVLAGALTVGGVVAGATPANATTTTISGSQNAFTVVHYNTPRTNTFSKNTMTLDPTQAQGGELAVGLRNTSGTQFARAASGGQLVYFKTNAGSTAIPAGKFYLNVKLSTACGADNGCNPYSWSAILTYNVKHPDVS